MKIRLIEFYHFDQNGRKYLKIFALQTVAHLPPYSFRIVVTPSYFYRLGTGLPSTLLAKAPLLA